MRIDEFLGFEQTDADEYTLQLFSDDGPNPDGILNLTLRTDDAVGLFEAVERELGGYVGEMRRERAAYDRATFEERDLVLGRAEPEVDPLEQADVLRDRMRGK